MRDDAFIICGSSAWAYWRTPPIVRDAVIPRETALAAAPDGAGLPPALLRARANMREADRLVQGRLLAELKGVPLPVHLMAPAHACRAATSLTVPRRPRVSLGDADVVPLGGGLFVTSPAETLRDLGTELSSVQLALAMSEGCGIFAVTEETRRAAFVMNRLLESGELSREAIAARREHIVCYCGADGAPLSQLARRGGPLPWEPGFDRQARPTGYWKRPPLTTIDEIGGAIARAHRCAGTKTARAALAMTHAGSASPLETRAHMLLFGTRPHGGEHWPAPSCNRRVDFTPAAQLLARQGWCSCDMLIPEVKADFEVNGLEYHTDEYGFKLESGRRAGLENMGYTVLDMTYDQLANLERFDALLQSFANVLSLPLKPRTAAFLRRRDELHRELFGPGPISLVQKTPKW